MVDLLWAVVGWVQLVGPSLLPCVLSGVQWPGLVLPDWSPVQFQHSSATGLLQSHLDHDFADLSDTCGTQNIAHVKYVKTSNTGSDSFSLFTHWALTPLSNQTKGLSRTSGTHTQQSEHYSRASSIAEVIWQRTYIDGEIRGEESTHSNIQTYLGWQQFIFCKITSGHLLVQRTTPWPWNALIQYTTKIVHCVVKSGNSWEPQDYTVVPAEPTYGILSNTHQVSNSTHTSNFQSIDACFSRHSWHYQYPCTAKDQILASDSLQYPSE